LQTRHQYEIHLENSSVVELCPEEDDIPLIYFNVGASRLGSFEGIVALQWAEKGLDGHCCAVVIKLVWAGPDLLHFHQGCEQQIWCELTTWVSAGGMPMNMPVRMQAHLAA